jgi:hypothetical protein
MGSGMPDMGDLDFSKLQGNDFGAGAGGLGLPDDSEDDDEMPDLEEDKGEEKGKETAGSA